MLSSNARTHKRSMMGLWNFALMWQQFRGSLFLLPDINRSSIYVTVCLQNNDYKDRLSSEENENKA